MNSRAAKLQVSAADHMICENNVSQNKLVIDFYYLMFLNFLSMFQICKKIINYAVQSRFI